MPAHHLILVRHAQAAQDCLGVPDRDRPLTQQGEQDALIVGDRIAQADIPLSDVHLWHSTARRTTQTAQAIAEHLPPSRIVHGMEALYDLNLYGILELVRETPSTIKTLIIVGHNPAIAETCHHLASNAVDGPIARELMKGYEPGTSTVFNVASDWAGLSPNTTTLRAVLHP
ncbi:SixA phosphatase family protein [Asaia prunellae]|uniref:SixA phosphatase family protein n=1 Tax=Asaia prunellae TaxID=610245 RepID=UPI00046F012C|nr:histidine phosphatase family protein [Asaia prunellae]